MILAARLLKTKYITKMYKYCTKIKLPTLKLEKNNNSTLHKNNLFIINQNSKKSYECYKIRV